MSNGELTLSIVDGVIDKKVADRRHVCGKDFLLVKDYYKSVIKSIAWVLTIVFIMFTGIVAWSYRPIKEISALQVEIRVVTEKLDHIIRQNGKR